jgi:hypothetical protein
MLADLVARAHGGRLTLPAVDRGFAADLRLGRPEGGGLAGPDRADAQGADRSALAATGQNAQRVTHPRS